MNPVKALIQSLPGGARLIERASFERRSRKLAKIGGMEERFTHIFARNKWKDAESRSGAGSSLQATSEIRRALPGLISELEVKSVLDAPCGDYNWFQHIDGLSELNYIGGDIVRPLIDANQQTHASERVSFIHLDITTDLLPAVDAWLCRDCLIHLSYADIERALTNFKRSKIRYWWLTTHRNIDRNIDIPTGHCRMLNLERAPFSFPEPLRYLADNDAENTGKCLAVWDRQQLVRVMMSAT